MDVSIRPMEPNDWETFQRLNAEVFASDAQHIDDLDTDWPYSETGISYYQKVCNGEYGIAFIAEHEGEAVGYVAIHKRHFGYRKSYYVEIDNIGVTPAYRSRGIGRKLMEKAEAWARDNNIPRLYVEAFFNNARGRAFYKEFGFTEIGIEFQKILH